MTTETQEKATGAQMTANLWTQLKTTVGDNLDILRTLNDAAEIAVSALASGCSEQIERTLGHAA